MHLGITNMHCLVNFSMRKVNILVTYYRCYPLIRLLYTYRSTSQGRFLKFQEEKNASTASVY